MNLGLKAALITIMWAMCLQSDQPVIAQRPETILRGTVSLSDRLAPVDKALLPGNDFDLTAFNSFLSSFEHESSWIKIPNGFAGRWESTESLDERLDISGRPTRKPKTVKAHFIEVHGHQEDKSGEIWEKILWGYTTVGEYNGHIFYQGVMTRYVDIDLRRKLQTAKSTSIMVEVDSNNRKILDTLTQESFSVWKLLKDGTIEVTSFSRDFDLNGNPRSTGRGTTTWRKIRDFHPLDTIQLRVDGEPVDLKSSFQRFMNELESAPARSRRSR